MIKAINLIILLLSLRSPIIISATCLNIQKSFKLSFIQEQHYSFTKVIKKTNGTMLYQPKNKFSISIVDNKIESKIISDGKTLWIYAPAEEPEDNNYVYIKNANKLSGLEAILFGCNNNAKKTTTNKLIQLTLDASIEKGYKSAVLSYYDSPFILKKLEYVDTNGTKIIVNVTKFDYLKTPSNSNFIFIPPKGAVIVR